MNRLSFITAAISGRLAAAGAPLALVIAGIIGSFVIGNALDRGPADHVGPADNSATLTRGGFAKAPNAPGCGEGGGGIALVGRLAPGHNLSELPQGSVRAIDGADPDLVVFWPGLNPFSLPDPQDPPTHPALVNVGWLRSNALDPALKSCDYRLEDNPAAAEIGRKAAAFMVQQGLLTQEQIDGPGTTFQLAEDPTNPAYLFFTVVLAKDGGGPGAALSQQLFPYTATIDKVSGAVLSAGRAHWYDRPQGCTPPSVC